MESTQLIKQGIVVLWALWLSTVVILNGLDALKGARLLPVGWRVHSHNLETLFRVTRIYDTPRSVVWLLFAGAIVWEATAAMLLWRAGLMSPAQEAFLPAATLAFAVALAMWGAFILMNEVFLTFVVEGQGGYSIAATHRSLFGVFLVSLLAVHLLP